MTSDDKILKILEVLSANVATILEEQHSQRSAINHMHKDIVVLKEDVGVLKEDVGVLKEDVGVLKEDVGVLKEDGADIKEDLTIIKQTMATKSDVARKLKDHDQRLDNLEDNAGLINPTKH